MQQVIASLLCRCWSIWLFIWTVIPQPYSACKPIFKVRKRPWPTQLTCCSPLMSHPNLLRSDGLKAHIYLYIQFFSNNNVAKHLHSGQLSDQFLKTHLRIACSSLKACIIFRNNANIFIIKYYIRKECCARKHVSEKLHIYPEIILKFSILLRHSCVHGLHYICS